MKKITYTLLALLFTQFAWAQDINKIITSQYVDRLIKTLSSDEMEGRATFSPGIDKAATFIESEFKTIGLKPLDGESGFRQTFEKDGKPLFNVVGMIPGKSKAKELVIFSGHYDHLGIVKGNEQDSIANGADDDASGITAMIALAKYYKALNNNQRTLVFVAFTAEELGGFGSKHFSKKLNPDDVVAMFNIEMIGKESKFGKNTAFITGFDKSDFGKYCRKTWPEQNLLFILILTSARTCFTEAIMPPLLHLAFRHIPSARIRLIPTSCIIQ